MPSKCVTPYAGVWIEITNVPWLFHIINVTPYAGVWIEIRPDVESGIWRGSLPTRECGLKFLKLSTDFIPECHSLRGSVDWNFCKIYRDRCDQSHSLRGSVDWNRYLSYLSALCWVTPYAGVWIEINMSLDAWSKQLVTPYAGVWIEIQCVQ